MIEITADEVANARIDGSIRKRVAIVEMSTNRIEWVRDQIARRLRNGRSGSSELAEKMAQSIVARAQANVELPLLQHRQGKAMRVYHH